MYSKLKPLLPYLMLLAMTGCAANLTTRLAASSSEYCRIVQPIHYNSKLDSPATVKAAQSLDSQWACLCQQDCPEAP